MSIRQKFVEIGFGSKGSKNAKRLINQDGSYNIIKKGEVRNFNLFHWMINLHWGQFFLVIFLGYVVMNSFFATLYWMIDGRPLTGSEQLEGLNHWLYCFYFSSQTLTTLGYGAISPTGNLSSLLSSFQAMIGLLSFAFATGLLYGKFSKAKAKLIFSEKMIIAPYRDMQALKFRVANTNKDEIINVHTRVMYSYLDLEESENSKRRFEVLKLEIDHISLFPRPWTIVHPIDGDSPLLDKTGEDFQKEDAEFIIIMTGYDDTFNQNIHQISSYKHHEMLFDVDFEPMFQVNKEGYTVVELDKINSFSKVV